MPRWARRLAVAALLLATLGCEEENTTLVTDIGIAALVLTDPGIGPQSVDPDEQTIQVMHWTLTPPATLARADGTTVDLLFDEPCRFIQTVRTPVDVDGRCSEGIILGASDPGETFNLSFTVQFMEVRRAKPPDGLGPGVDYDGDNVNNELDNCPLLANKDQEDDDGDGIGDACRIEFFGGDLLESDGDGVPDLIDNCVWIPNADQNDTHGVGEENGVDIEDGIGDACTEEQALVTNVPAVFESQTLTFDLSAGGVGFVTLDFEHELVLTGPDWDDGSTQLIKPNVATCGVSTGIADALDGCRGSD